MRAIIRKDEQAVSPVIATILMVAITVVLAAVLYVMVSGLIGGTSTTTKPTVTLTVNKITGGVSILVAGIQPASPPANFKVNIQNGTNQDLGTAILMPAKSGNTVTVIVDTVTFTIKWQNTGGSGQVSQGDTFVVTYSAASGTHWNFLLIWAADGSVLPTNSNWIA